MHRLVSSILLLFLSILAVHGETVLPDGFRTVEGYPFIVYTDDENLDKLQISDSLFYKLSLGIHFQSGQSTIVQDDPIYYYCREIITPVLLDPSVWKVRFLLRGAASPEGTHEQNVRLGEERTSALTDLLIRGVRRPKNQPFAVEFVSVAEDFRYLVHMMRQAGDPDLKVIEEILNRCNWDEEQCNEEIRKLMGGALWNRLYYTYFPRLRATRLVMVVHRYRPKNELSPLPEGIVQNKPHVGSLPEQPSLLSRPQPEGNQQMDCCEQINGRLDKIDERLKQLEDIEQRLMGIEERLERLTLLAEKSMMYQAQRLAQDQAAQSGDAALLARQQSDSVKEITSELKEISSVLNQPTEEWMADARQSSDSARTQLYQHRREWLSLKTNLLLAATYVPQYGFTTIPNVAIEYYPRHGHFTYGASFDCPWWQHYDEQRFLQIRNYQLHSRYYLRSGDEDLREPGQGAAFARWYFSVYAHAAIYNVCLSPTKGWEGEGFGAGIGAGYVLPLGRSQHWRLELGAQFGFFRTQYDPYQWLCPIQPELDPEQYYYKWYGDAKDFKRRQYRYNWLGPTRVEITISYDLLYRKIKKRGISLINHEPKPQNP